VSKKQHHENKVEVETTAIETETIDKTAELQQEVLDWKDKYMRNMAEFENFRKRSNQEKADWIRMATQKFAMEICDVADNFERALLQASEQELLNSFGKGVVLIEKQLRQALEKEGVKKIEALGEEFDPAYHDALAHIPSDYEENTVAAIIQNGYTMNDKLLRPARVAVSSGNHKNIKSLEE
jgi:molecular chaperone GrpE